MEQKNQLRLRILFLTMLFSVVSVFGSFQCIAQTYISKVAVAGGGNRYDWMNKNGYTAINVDLNSGKKGSTDIILGYQTSNSPLGAITGLVVCENTSSPKIINGRTYYLAPYNSTDGFNGDMNNDAGGKYLYLFYTTDNPDTDHVLQSLNVITNDHSQSSSDYVCKYNGTDDLSPNADLNEAAGGKYIYIEAKHNNDPYLQITFKANGGSGKMDDYAFTKSGVVPTNEFTRVGYQFINWNTQSDGKGWVFQDKEYLTIGQASVQSGYMTLYAQWQKYQLYNITSGKQYINAQSGIDEARAGDTLKIETDISSDLKFKQSILVDLCGYKINGKVLLQNAEDPILLYNGTIGGDISSGVADSESKNYHGTVVLKDVNATATVYSDYHTIDIEGGVYNSIMSNTASGKVNVYGVNTYINNINAGSATYYPGVTLYGGIYKSVPGQMNGVTIADGYDVIKLAEAPLGAPDKEYKYNVNRNSSVIESFVKTTNADGKPANYVTLSSSATENTELQVHVKINTINKGINALFGTSGKDGVNGNDAFAVWVDGKDNSFNFSTGTKSMKSPAGLAKTGTDYYFTLKSGHFEVDTLANADTHLYHHDYPVYPFHKNANSLTIGKINGESDDYIADINLYSVKVLEGDETVYDLAPAYHRTLAEAGECMFDMLSGEYLIAPTGGFFEGQISTCQDGEHYGYYMNNSDSRICLICGKSYQISANDEPYIAFNGTSYFDTGYVPNDNTEIRMHFINTDTHGTQDFFGIGYNKPHSEFAFYNSVSDLKVLYPKASALTADASNQDHFYNHSLFDSGEYYLKMNMKEIVIGRDAGYEQTVVDYKFNSASYVQENGLTLTVGAIRYPISSDPNAFGEKCASFQLFSYEIYENGKMIHQFVPDAEHGRYGFRDTIDKSFHPMRGTGATASIDPNEDSYINTKAQYYYCTKTAPSNDAKTVIRMKINGYDASDVNGNHIFGCYQSDFSRQYTLMLIESGGKYALKMHNRKDGLYCDYTTNYALQLNEYYEIETYRDDSHVYINVHDIDGKSIISFAEAKKDDGWDVKSDNGIWLFNDCKQDNNYVGNYTVYGMEIYKGNVLECQYMPHKNSDGTPCLYDAVSHKVLTPYTRSAYSLSDDMVKVLPCQQHEFGAIQDHDGKKMRQCNVCGVWEESPNYILLTNKSGSTHIVTDFYPNQHTEVQIHAVTGNSLHGDWFGVKYTDNRTQSPLFNMRTWDNAACYVVNQESKSGKLPVANAEYWAAMGSRNLVFSLDKWRSGDQITRRYTTTSSLSTSSFTTATPLWIGNADNSNTSDDMDLYVMDFIAWDNSSYEYRAVRKYIPAKRDGKYGLFDEITQTFVLPSKDAEGYVAECAEHKYIDYKQSSDGKWQQHCRVCDALIDMPADESEAFIRTNGSSYFDTGYKPKANTKIVAHLKINDYDADTEVQPCQDELIYGAYAPGNTLQLSLSKDELGNLQFQPGGEDVTVPATLNKEYFIIQTPDTFIVSADRARTNIVGSALLKNPNTHKNVNQTIRIGVHSTEQNRRMANEQIYEFSIYEDDVLVHHFVPSIYGNQMRMYDTVDPYTAFRDMSNVQTAPSNIASAYIPQCSYHKYYGMEKNDKGNYQKHCYICNAVEELNILKVKSEDDLKKVEPENEEYTIYLDMYKNGMHEQNVALTYPTVDADTYIFEYATMHEGSIKHYFLPGTFNKNNGVYDVEKDTFIVIPYAEVNILANCEHKYKTRTLTDGVVHDHCYICDAKSTAGYYMDVNFEGNGATAGKMGTQRIVISDAVKLNDYRKNLGIFEGWRMKNADNTEGELILDGATVNVTEAHKEPVTFVAQWIDAFTYNGDTLTISDDNTAKIDIVDNGEDGFASAKTFAGAHYSYQRPINSGTKFGTICLPFAINADEHPDFDLYVAKDVTSVENGNSTINLQKVESISAGIPCIFKLKNDTDLFRVEHNGSEEIAISAGTNAMTGLTLYGTYEQLNIDTKEKPDLTYYVVQGDTFFRVVTSISVRPYRAYITSNSVNAARECYYLNFDDATGIISVDGELVDMNDAEFYSVSGVKLNAPQKGVNIVKMKNGETRKIRY